MGHIRLIIFDLDRTLWNHADVSSMEFPFMLKDPDTIIDRKGDKLKLFPGVREVLSFLKKKQKLLAVASWNEFNKAFEAMKLLGIDKFFDVIVIENHPNKDIMLVKILNEFEKRGIKIKPEEIVFVDDQEMHKEQVKKIGNIVFIQMGKDARNFSELLEIIKNIDE